MSESKNTGLGTIVWLREVTAANPCDLTITSVNGGLYSLFGCAYSVTPPGTSWTTVEEDQCLDGGNVAVQTWATGQIYSVGTIIRDQNGNLWQVIAPQATTPTAGDDTNLPTSDTSDHAYAAYSAANAADPAAKLGRKEANEIEIVRNFSPGGLQTEQLRAWAKGATKIQAILQYPPQLIEGPVGTFAQKIANDTFCGFVRSSVPDAVTPEEFMRATYSILRDGDWRTFSV